MLFNDMDSLSNLEYGYLLDNRLNSKIILPYRLIALSALVTAPTVDQIFQLVTFTYSLPLPISNPKHVTIQCYEK